jgi:hypothetical protein
MTIPIMPLLLVLLLPADPAPADSTPGNGSRVGVVSHLLVVSDRVPDVSSMEAWKKSFLKEGMTDQEKALAAWRATVMFQHQDVPPREYLHNEEIIQDPIKTFNVYGYSFCSAAACDVEALARYAGLKARGWAINGHSVPEVYWDGAWHLLDGSLINYFPKTDGTVAGVEEVMAAVKEWYDEHPEYKGNDAKLRAFQSAEGWTGWKKGPALLTLSPFYDAGGFWPAHTHGWFATMQEYDGTYGNNGKPFLYEYGYSQGYQVNIQLRHGERLTRNWGNRGLHINAKDGGAPGCLTEKTGAGSLVYTPEYGDLAPGRVGNGTLEYDVPLAGGAYRRGALAADNLDERSVRVKDASRPGTLVLRMPSSYVYLSGALNCTTAVGTGGSIVLSLSDNNGLDWQEIARWTSPGEQHLDLTSRVLRRYDYRLKFEFHGRDAGLDALRIVHDIQHSQRPLPTLGPGENAITFTAGPPEGTVTVEGATNLANKGKQLVYTDFHPEMSGFEPNLFIGSSGRGTITFPIATPGNLVRLRFGAHYRARDARDGLDYQVSFDGGQTWKTVERAAGPTPGDCKYTIVTDIPLGTRDALVRFTGTNRNATGLLNFRIDADYREPEGGFCPVKVTYTWEENGQPKQDVHVARQPQETYTITCATKPLMKAIVMELAE